jgi:hypothetical protein
MEELLEIIDRLVASENQDAGDLDPDCEFEYPLTVVNKDILDELKEQARFIRLGGLF